MDIPSEWIKDFIWILFAAITALAGYLGWLNRQITKAFFDQLPKITEALDAVSIQMIKQAEQISVQNKDHKQHTKALRCINRSLQQLCNDSNGVHRPKGGKEL